MFDHQTLHGFSEIIRSPAWHWKACLKSSLFFKVSKTLTIAGGCGSPCSCPTKSAKVLASHHPRAYPMKNSFKKILEVNPAGFMSGILIGILAEFTAVCFSNKIPTRDGILCNERGHRLNFLWYSSTSPVKLLSEKQNSERLLKPSLVSPIGI